MDMKLTDVEPWLFSIGQQTLSWADYKFALFFDSTDSNDCDSKTWGLVEATVLCPSPLLSEG